MRSTSFAVKDDRRGALLAGVVSRKKKCHLGVWCRVVDFLTRQIIHWLLAARSLSCSKRSCACGVTDFRHSGGVAKSPNAIDESRRFNERVQLQLLFASLGLVATLSLSLSLSLLVPATTRLRCMLLCSMKSKAGLPPSRVRGLCPPPHDGTTSTPRRRADTGTTRH